MITNVLIMQLWLHVISWQNPFCTSKKKDGMGGDGRGCCAHGNCLANWGAVLLVAALAGSGVLCTGQLPWLAEESPDHMALQAGY